MASEIFRLLRAMLWPLTTLSIVLMYRQEIRNILIEMPPLAKRLLSLKAMGAEVILESLSLEISKAEKTSSEIVVPLGEIPKRELADESK